MAKPQSFDRLLWRAADRIHARLTSEEPWLTDLLSPETHWHDWRVCLHRIRRAQNQKWAGAVETVRQEALETLADLKTRLEDCRNVLASRRSEPPVSSVGDIYRDLVALRDEFPKVAVEFSHGSVSATTKAIVLEGIYLGPFEIRLSWTSTCSPLIYRVSACDPHAATTSNEVTHPHVEAKQLCEGEGRSVIRQTLQQGRLADFFLIVRQILATYNSASAYVPLDQWSGRDCPDCAASMLEDDAISCSECETDICGECGRDCQNCGESFCAECQSSCSRCSNHTCHNCLKACSGCDASVCDDCFENCSRCNSTRCEGCLDEGLCPECCSNKEETDPSHTPAADAVPDVAVHPVCLGEAVVSA